ncbi:MAG: hypothetical protein AAF492_10975, partial [Verrucomicrobiota bacterium]
LGGHQFLEAFEKEFSPYSLNVLWDNIPATKLGGGTYAAYANVVGEHYIVLNAFHPYQLEPYYDPRNVIVIFEGLTQTPWADLRQKMVGATKPAQAAEHSLRHDFLQREAELGMTDVSPRANGVHLSAGPLEGMVELARFLADHENGADEAGLDTCFGQLLGRKGIDDAIIAEMAKNPEWELNGEIQSTFDMTEEMDAEAAAAKLAEAAAACRS